MNTFHIHYQVFSTVKKMTIIQTSTMRQGNSKDTQRLKNQHGIKSSPEQYFIVTARVGDQALIEQHVFWESTSEI